jgi:S-methylmethionine-dependent homocysteine/selenocysteine methylase
MPRYRYNLPQLSQELFLTDGGIETTLIFDRGMDLPHFAAFNLFKHREGELALERYFQNYASLARDYRVGIILESPTWRANSDWGAKLGYSKRDLKEINRKSIVLLEKIRKDYETKRSKMVISGCIGSRSDGYQPAELMAVAEAEAYHFPQIATFADTEADLVTAMTMTNVEEAIGIVRAARCVRMPVAVSFTIETDGRLPTGQTLKEAIDRVDRETHQTPLYYGINCAHPSHFAELLSDNEPWVQRIRCIRANASPKSHAELNEAAELDEGDLEDLGYRYRELVREHQHFNILGGCCGTDIRHVEAICLATLPMLWMHLSRDSLVLLDSYSFAVSG